MSAAIGYQKCQSIPIAANNRPPTSWNRILSIAYVLTWNLLSRVWSTMLMMLLCRVGAWNGCCSAVAFRIPHTHIYVFYSICVQNRTYEIHESRYRKSGSLSSGSYSLLLCTRYQVSAVVCTGRHYILKLFCCRLHLSLIHI